MLFERPWLPGLIPAWKHATRLGGERRGGALRQVQIKPWPSQADQIAQAPSGLRRSLLKIRAARADGPLPPDALPRT